MIYVFIFLLAFWAGFSVRRASLCLVRATHEIIERKPLKTMFFILQAMVVALSITIPAILLFPEKVLLASSYNISWYLLLGGVFYGIGASLNGACALGTLNQLMNGKATFLGSIIGIALGFLIFLNIQHVVNLQKLDISGIVKYRILFLLPLMFLVWSIVFFRVKNFWNTSEGSKLRKLKQYINSSVARDFIGVTIFGFCSGTLFLILGSSWDHTQFIQHIERSIYQGGTLDYSVVPILVTTLALVFGMGCASLLSKDFKFELGKLKDFFTKVIAGILMGFSVGLIPGGNDTLILYGLPGFSLHAPIALLVMMGTIATLAYLGRLFEKL